MYRIPAALVLVGHTVLGALTATGLDAPTGLAYSGYLLGQIIGGYLIYVLTPLVLVNLPVFLFTRYRSAATQLRIAFWLWLCTGALHVVEIVNSHLGAV